MDEADKYKQRLEAIAVSFGAAPLTHILLRKDWSVGKKCPTQNSEILRTGTAVEVSVLKRPERMKEHWMRCENHLKCSH